MSIRVRTRWAAVLLLIAAAACGGSTPNQPTPPPTLVITCPPNRSVQSPEGNPTGVSFDAPQTVGGAAPVTTTCNPASGAEFAVGNTTVTCEARDSGNRQASCSFTVQVQAPPRLTATRFLAFGDSLTYGVISASVTLLVASVPDSYPFVLQDRLVARYRQQTPVVLNEGNPGELAAQTGVQRFRSVLLAHRPDVVLLMEGTNDLLFGQTGANNAVDALRAMIREAKSQNVRIVLSTVPPQRPGGARRRDAVVALIPGFNDRIRGLASAENIPLIDVYDGMKDDLTLIGVDDLHPTVRGYDVMADIYYNAIRMQFENQPPSGSRW